MPTSPIGNELESDLRTTPEKYTEDLHKEMKNLHGRIEKEMDIEADAIEKDEEMIDQLENMMSLYARYESDLISFVSFLQKEPDDADDMVMAMRFRDAIQDGEIEISNNPTELPQVIRSIEKDFKNVFDDLEEKDKELKEVLNQDYGMEEEIEIIEKMAKKLETMTSVFEEASNSS